MAQARRPSTASERSQYGMGQYVTVNIEDSDIPYYRNAGYEIIGGPSAPAPTPTAQPQQQQQQQQDTYSWSKTSGSFDSTTGKFITKPTLTLEKNGVYQTHQFENAQEYINAMQSFGFPSSEVDKLRNTLQPVINVATKYETTKAQEAANPPAPVTPAQPTNQTQIANPPTTAQFGDAFVAKYGRSPTQAEMDKFLADRKSVTLDNILTSLKPADAGTGAGTNTITNFDVSSYPKAFQDYINSIKSTVQYQLTPTAIANLYEQYQTMGPPGTQDENTVGAPLQEGEYDWIVQKYIDSGYSPEEAQAKADEITATRPGSPDFDLGKYLKYLEDKDKAAADKSAQALVDSDKKTADALAYIDASGLPTDLKELWKSVVRTYPDGVEVNPKDILESFNKIKSQTLDPYFAELTSLAQQDFKNAVQYMNDVRKTELETEKMETTAALDKSRSGLESSGLTFSGEGVKQLGTESAYAGVNQEGIVPAARRLIASSSNAKNIAQQKDTGLKAEGQLGSSFASSLTLPNYSVLGNVQGSLKRTQQEKEADTLSALVGQNALKEKANLNVV